MKRPKPRVEQPPPLDDDDERILREIWDERAKATEENADEDEDEDEDEETDD